MTSMMTSVSGSATRWAGASVSSPPDPAPGRAQVADGDRDEGDAAPVGTDEPVGLAEHPLSDGATDRARAEHGDGQGLSAHGRGGDGRVIAREW